MGTEIGVILLLTGSQRSGGPVEQAGTDDRGLQGVAVGGSVGSVPVRVWMRSSR